MVGEAKKTITRQELCEAVYRKVGLSRSESSDFVEKFLDEVTACITSGESLKLSSFGTFLIRSKSERIGRNPKTGVEAPITPRDVVIFRPSHVLRNKINA